MKKLILLSIIFVIGCAHKPPEATFYIGMTEKEFLIDNEITFNADGFYNYESKNRIIYQRGNSEYLHSIAPKLYPKDQPYIMYSETKHQNKLSPYYFIFENDSLIRVYKGVFNLASEKEIDYDKYATPPEWFAGYLYYYLLLGVIILNDSFNL